MGLSPLDYLAAAGAAGVAGAINALAGGGSLVSFPTLVALGVPPVAANVTNTVALLPGYLSGTWAQREDLRPQVRRARVLAIVAAAGGLAGSVLLVVIPASAFRAAVPYLILASCALLLGQDRIRTIIRPAPTTTRPATGRPAESPEGTPPEIKADDSSPDTDAAHWTPALMVTIFAAAVYGGFFGAGLGIMLLALLGLFSAEPLVRLNALKQALSFVINLVAAIFFVFSGDVRWDLAPLMAAAALIGGFVGGRLVQVIDPVLLRRLVVVAGVAVAVAFWVV